MNTNDELKVILANNAIKWNKEESQDRALIYVDDFLNELKSKFKLLPIQNVTNRTSVDTIEPEQECGTPYYEL